MRNLCANHRLTARSFGALFIFTNEADVPFLMYEINCWGNSLGWKSTCFSYFRQLAFAIFFFFKRKTFTWTLTFRNDLNFSLCSKIRTIHLVQTFPRRALLVLLSKLQSLISEQDKQTPILYCEFSFEIISSANWIIHINRATTIWVFSVFLLPIYFWSCF